MPVFSLGVSPEPDNSVSVVSRSNNYSKLRGLKFSPTRFTRVSLLAALAILLQMVMLTLGSSTLTALAATVATDGPGSMAYHDLARKDCVGTAVDSPSKVWFTLADGVLSDTYFPTIDNNNVKSLEYVVTDGSTFTDLQRRDTTYTVRLLNTRALDCEVTSTAKNGKYQIVTQYLTDPDRPTVLIRSRLVPRVSGLKLYLRYDPSINGNGGGGAANAGGDTGTLDYSLGYAVPVAYDTKTTSQAANRDYAQPVYSALRASSPFLKVTNGFAGTGSDGLTQLDTSHSLTALYDGATNGNLVQTAQLDLSHGNTFVLALGFGNNQSEAVSAARNSLEVQPDQSNTKFEQAKEIYEERWNTYDDRLNEIPDNYPGVSRANWKKLVDQYYLSMNVVKASVDKTFPGAAVAGLASPWGQAVSASDPNNLYFGSYREVFARDLYETWTGVYLAGDYNLAQDMLNFLFYRQQLPDGSIPRNSLLNGKTAPDSFGTQLDEVAYPILMAYQLSKLGRYNVNDANLYQNHIKSAANFVISHGPAYGVERWEEQGGYSPSTIAAEIAGLVAAADIARANGDNQSAQLWLGVADDWQRSTDKWFVTTNGPLANYPYYIRLSKTGDANAAISYNVGNGGPTLDQRAIIDAGFLELVRLGLKPANDPTVAQSLQVVDSTIKRNTASGPGWLRYNGDGYGDCAASYNGDTRCAPDGRPWSPSGIGNGHVWPLLNNERGEYALANGNKSFAVQMLQTIRNFGSGVGLTPEQDWEFADLAASPFGTDPTVASIGFQNGKPVGSASPLTWATASYVRLMQDLVAGKIQEQPANTYKRYVQNQPTQTTLTVTAPADQSAVSTGSVTITGTSVAGNTIYVAATNTDQNTQTTTSSTVVGTDGTFSLTLPVTGGTTVLNIVAVSPTGATAHVVRTIVYDFTPGTIIFDQIDPSNDDNGPGNYAYPKADAFKPGAYDLQEFRVIDDGTNIIFKVKVRDLSPTFGSPLGAQLLDVYIHDPNAAATTTQASYPSRNYSIASSGAWNKLIEVQGFGQRYVDANFNTLGTVSISANAISRFITFSVPKSSLGQPTTGWGFTVALTGQDGFSSDQARGFQSTPQDYQFGVCQTASSDPHCTVNPNTVPKVLDTLTPAGVSQADELDYTLHNPVVLQPVVIP